MLEVTYRHLCDACGAQIGAENFRLTNASTVPAPAPARYGALPGGWLYNLCESCFEPLREPLREVARAGQAVKDAATNKED